MTIPQLKERSKMTVIERVEVAMARLLLSATSVDREVREEADDAVKNLVTENEYLRAQLAPGGNPQPPEGVA